jgi:carbamoyltransferase
MNYIGISCGFHDAAIAVVDSSGNIQFAAHSERYNQQKHTAELAPELITDALKYTDGDNQIHYYERPVVKFLRQLRAGESPRKRTLSAKNIIGKSVLKQFGSSTVHTHNHHLSHAAAGFQTSTFDRATVVVIDAIGEFDTVTIWGAYCDDDGRAKYRLLWRQTYPDSIGLFYSAMTQRVGLRPLDEEYILMGMAGWGIPNATADLATYAVESFQNTTFNHNFHTGVDKSLLFNYSENDIAASTQAVAENLISAIMHRAQQFNWSSNLVYGGGVALNCLANRNLGKYFDRIWILPNPGDAGSSLGAAALGYGGHINWRDAYLGYDMGSDYPIARALDILCDSGIVGVASGRAEWGPRALGNRSLLADPRGYDIKDRVNDIKQRQRFRPFAPVILEEHVDEYFDMPTGFETSPYMQTVARCRHADKFPAIVHVDGTSRVQTVARDSKSGIRQLLEAWYERTGCPMLLNTSLNVRGEPMVNNRSDADRFEYLYGIPVVS